MPKQCKKVLLYCVTIKLYNRDVTDRLTHEEAHYLCTESDDVQLVEGNVEERHKAVEALEEDTLHYQRRVPLVHRPRHMVRVTGKNPHNLS